MKLVFSAYPDLDAAHLVSTPSTRFNKDGTPTYASFTCDGTLPFNDVNPPKGEIKFMSDDDMMLNTFVVEDFLRYEMRQNYKTVEVIPEEIAPSEGTSTGTDNADVESQAEGEVTEGTEGETEEITPTPTYEQIPTNYTITLTNTPIPEPAPEPIPPTEEELLAQAKAGRDTAITTAMSQAIYNGIDVKTEYGVEHFTLTTEDQTLLLGIYGMMQQGITQYPYHSVNSNPNSRSNNICVVYSDEDIGKIAVAAFGHITYHESYANMLLQWLAREADRQVVYTIEYGAQLPSDLIQYLAMILTAAGIDPIVIPGYTESTTDSGSTESGSETTEPSTDGTTGEESQGNPSETPAGDENSETPAN